MPTGSALHWENLDADLGVPQLVSGLFGSKAWMTELGRHGGQSKDESCLHACLGYENSYCSSNHHNYYVTIDNFLGKYQLIKPISTLLKIADRNPIQIATLKSLEAKIRKNETIIVVTLCSTFTLLSWLFSYLFSNRLSS